MEKSRILHPSIETHCGSPEYRGFFSVGAMSAKHPQFFEINVGAPTSAPTIFWDSFKRGTHDLEIQRGPWNMDAKSRRN